MARPESGCYIGDLAGAFGESGTHGDLDTHLQGVPCQGQAKGGGDRARGQPAAFRLTARACTSPLPHDDDDQRCDLAAAGHGGADDVLVLI